MAVLYFTHLTVLLCTLNDSCAWGMVVCPEEGHTLSINQSKTALKGKAA